MTFFEGIFYEAIKAFIKQITNWALNKLDKKNRVETNFLESSRNLFIQRIYEIFNLHEINKEDIPKILKDFDISLADLSYEETIIKKFDDEVITYIANTFEINKDWIYGRNNNVMIKPPDEYGFYKNSTHFAKILLESKPTMIYILTETIPNKDKDEKNDTNTICIIAKYNKQINANFNIITYHVYDESCRYGYWKCRYELKRFLLYIKKAHQSILLEGRVIFNLKSRIKIFQEGKIKFSELLVKSKHWTPSAYVSFVQESSHIIYEELDELKKIDEEYDRIEHYV